MADHEQGESPASEHRARGPRQVACWVVTISDTRTEENDTSGDAIRQALTAAGHEVRGSRIVKDDPARIREAVLEAEAGGAQVVVTTGGTGLTSRDSTYEVLSALIARPIPGFGELFRYLSYDEIQSAAMLSRATAGVLAGGAVVFALPGSSKGVKLGMDKLVVPELSHVLEQLSR